jgi:hypothetical protein
MIFFQKKVADIKILRTFAVPKTKQPLAKEIERQSGNVALKSFQGIKRL